MSFGVRDIILIVDIAPEDTVGKLSSILPVAISLVDNPKLEIVTPSTAGFVSSGACALFWFFSETSDKVAAYLSAVLRTLIGVSISDSELREELFDIFRDRTLVGVGTLKLTDILSFVKCAVGVT